MEKLSDTVPPASSVMRCDFGQFLKQHSGKNVFFEPLAGNNGDELIRRGACHVFQKNHLKLVSNVEAASLIVINGGGSMNDLWLGDRVLRRLRAAAPKTPLVIAPSSFWFATSAAQANFAAACAEAESTLTLFARERTSLKNLLEMRLPPFVQFGLDHDLALQLRDSPWLAEQKLRCQENYLLLALRRDREGSSGKLGSLRARWLPSALRTRLSRLRDRATAWRKSRENPGLNAGLARWSELPRKVEDVSATGDFDHFAEVISQAAAVITDRLHVAILSDLLGKQVQLGRGAYHKNFGVAELSLSHRVERCAW